jgi:D-serine dehydratase
MSNDKRKIDDWIKEIPHIKDIQSRKEIFWLNPKRHMNPPIPDRPDVTNQEIIEAAQRLERFSPFIMKVFPETSKNEGIIESPLLDISAMKISLEKRYKVEIDGQLLLKCDNLLPISGSIKARGGIYEVLKHAENLAFEHQLLKIEDNYSIMANEKFKKFFSNYKIAVGSTGNLGLSIGVIGAKLGFQVTVHMSADAKLWKKDLLRNLGVDVIEYESDYSKAVDEGRKQAKLDENCYFVDDESSKHLFIGYAVAAARLEKQLKAKGIVVDEEHPLFVYLPCGVGGGPGGVTYGLNSIYHKNVHCFFVEPTDAPCLLLGMATGLGDQISVSDFGLTNQTIADGLAVGKASSFVMKNMEKILSGVFTINDESLSSLVKNFWNEEKIFLEPSAVAGTLGPINLLKTEIGSCYLEKCQLREKMVNATHIIWATGGNMVPVVERERLLR